MKTWVRLIWLLAVVFVTNSVTRLAGAEASANEYWVYFGTYTRGASEGIYRAKLDVPAGALSEVELAAESENPSFLAVAPDGTTLYAANEVGGGAVTAFRIDRRTGGLTRLNEQPTRGGAPCHVSVDRSGRMLMVANYGGGSVASFPIKAGGALEPAVSFVQHEGSSINKRRQESPHAHYIAPDVANRHALVADLGLDKVLVYAIDPASARMTEKEERAFAVEPGAGPRHLTFHPGGGAVYVINELNCTVTVCAYDSKTGALENVQTLSTLPGDFEEGFSTAEIEAHPSGRFVYGSNRGHHSIVVYEVEAETKRLKAVQHQNTLGKTPRNFAIEPGGRLLLAANQGTDNVVVFRIDSESGRLKETGNQVEVPTPVCVVYVERAE